MRREWEEVWEDSREQGCDVWPAGYLGTCIRAETQVGKGPSRRGGSLPGLGEEHHRAGLHKNFTEGQMGEQLSPTGIQGHLLLSFLHHMLAG